MSEFLLHLQDFRSLDQQSEPERCNPYQPHRARLRAHQNLVLPCLTPQPVRLALMASLSSFRANRMSYSNRNAPTDALNCLSDSALRLMR